MNAEASGLAGKTLAELWALFPVELAPHDPGFARLFEQESARIRAALGEDNVFRLAHIGSTAVPGLAAKPTLDMLLEIAPGCEPAFLCAALVGIGYLAVPQPNKPAPYVVFYKGYGERGYEPPVEHLHVRFPGDWDEPYFRDYLRAHPAAAAEYAELKVRLARTFRHDRDAYTESKGPFVASVTAKARAAYPGRYAV